MAAMPGKQKNTFLAGAAYLLLFLSWLGLIADIIIYYTAKDRYAKFHAGQACFLELGIVVFSLLLSFVMVGSMGYAGLSLAGGFYMYILALTVLISLLYIGLAIAAFMGREFRIPLAADLLEK